MKKFLFLTIIVVLRFTCTAIAASVVPVFLNTYEGGGPYLPYPSDGPYPNGAPYSLVAHGDGNDNYDNMKTVDDYWIVNDLLLTQLTALDKFEFGEGWETDKNDPNNTFSIDPVNATDTGTWKYVKGQLTDSDPDNDFELFFSIKTSTNWNLFSMNSNWYNDSTINNAVVWSTLNNFFKTNEDNLGDKDISHISFWKGPQVPDSVVPEPATMILFGFGLIGLARIGRSKKIS